MIGTLCENLDTLDESEAKASMIWIVGEYAGRIDNAAELMENFVENFAEDPAQVVWVYCCVSLSSVCSFLTPPWRGL